MRFSTAAAVLLSVASVQAAQHIVKVGDNNGLVFNPTELDGAVVGDTVSFQFQSKNHSVTQSTFAAPCTKLDGGADSGFMLVAAGATSLPQWSFNVTNASAPLWFFCAQTIPADHCGMGMVFALNPTANKTFDMFQTAAKATLSSNGTATANGTTAANGTTSGSSASGTSTAPAGTKSSSALKLGGSAAGLMSVAALIVGFAL